MPNLIYLPFQNASWQPSNASVQSTGEKTMRQTYEHVWCHQCK